MSSNQVYLWHMLMISPLLVYIGNKKENTPENVFNMLGLLTTLIPFVVRIPKFKLDFHDIALAIHYIGWIPLFLYIAYYKNNLPEIVYPIILYIGLAAFAIHAYHLLV